MAEKIGICYGEDRTSEQSGINIIALMMVSGARIGNMLLGNSTICYAMRMRTKQHF